MLQPICSVNKIQYISLATPSVLIFFFKLGKRNKESVFELLFAYVLIGPLCCCKVYLMFNPR